MFLNAASWTPSSKISWELLVVVDVHPLSSLEIEMCFHFSRAILPKSTNSNHFPFESQENFQITGPVGKISQNPQPGALQACEASWEDKASGIHLRIPAGTNGLQLGVQPQGGPKKWMVYKGKSY